MTVGRWIGLDTSLLAIVGGLVCFAAPVAARQDAGTGRALEGQVVDAAGAAVPEMDVVLHRVTDAGGAVVGQARTGADGRFRIELAEAASDGVYFVAVRYEGQLHIGPMIRPPFPAGPEYVVSVGGEPVDAGAGAIPSTAPPAPPADNGSRLGAALVIGLLGTATAAVIVIAARRPNARRRLLIRLAREEERAGAGGTSK